MKWLPETPLPFNPTGAMYLSQIEYNDIYLIDSGTNFWRYDAWKKRYTQLAVPATATSTYSPMRIRNGKIYCVRGNYPATKIHTYDIDANTWTESAACPSGYFLRSFAFEDDDTIWAWAVDTGLSSVKCMKYVISTDTWTQYAASYSFTYPQAYYFTADYTSEGGGIVYGAPSAYTSGLANRYLAYLTSIDSYSISSNRSNTQYMHAYVPGYLPYYMQDDHRYGYLQISDLSFHDDVYEANGVATQWYYAGMRDDWSSIIAWAKTNAPELWATSPTQDGFAPISPYLVEVDWDNDGVFEGGDEDITDDVFGEIIFDRGIDEELEHVAAGTLQLTVKNPSGKYSPDNSGSALYPNVLPGRPVRIRKYQSGSLRHLWRGFIEKFVPHPRQDVQDCFILAVDGMDQLDRVAINAPEGGTQAEVKIGGATQVFGVNITFADADPDTITRASGSFVDDGYVAGNRVTVAGSTNNNGVFLVASVSATVLTLDADESLTDEGPVGGVTIDVLGPIVSILDEAGWPSARRSLDEGVDSLEVWWAHRQSALAAARELMDAERSLIYMDEENNFVYEDRHHRYKDGGGGSDDHLSSQGTFSDTMTAMPYEFSARTVRNVARVTGHKRAAQSSAKLWGTQDRPLVGAGQSIDIWAVFANPVASADAPGKTTDWQVSDTADGAADATLLANCTLTSVLYGQSMKMTIANNNAQPVYLIPGTGSGDDTLYIDGEEYDDDEVFAEKQDATSIAAYGERAVSVDNAFQGSFYSLWEYANWLVSRYKNPQREGVAISLINTTDALEKHIVTRKISDRITVTCTELGITSQDYFINKMTHRIRDGGLTHEVEWKLVRVDEDSPFWLIGVAGYSELGETTTLGF